MNKLKKAQIWYTDFIIGVIIFATALVIYFEYTNAIDVTGNNILDELITDAKSISSCLLSEGSPSNWTTESVQRIGLTNGDYRINQTKLESFAEINYNSSRQILGTTYDYYFYLEEKDGTQIEISGEEGIGYPNSDADQLIQMTRFVVYNSSITKMVVEVWD